MTIGAAAHAGVCGAYEDDERASFRALTLADFEGAPPREIARAKGFVLRRLARGNASR
jgi:hypothetical protein